MLILFLNSAQGCNRTDVRTHIRGQYCTQAWGVSGMKRHFRHFFKRNNGVFHDGRWCGRGANAEEIEKDHK